MKVVIIAAGCLVLGGILGSLSRFVVPSTNEAALLARSDVEASPQVTIDRAHRLMALADTLAQAQFDTEARKSFKNRMVAWAEEDPEAAALWFVDNVRGDPSVSFPIVAAIVSNLAKKDLDLASDWMMRFPDPRLRAVAGYELAQHVVASDAVDWKEFWRALDSEQGALLKDVLAGEMAKRRPQELTEFLFRHETGDGGVMARVSLRRWAQADPDGALKWLADRPESERDLGQVKSALRGVFQASAVKGAENLDLLPEGTRRNDLLVELAGQWAESDLDGAFAWVDALDNRFSKIRASKAIIHEMAKTDIARASELASEFAATNAESEFYLSYAKRRAKSDPQGVLQWANELNDPVLRHQAKEAGLQQWLQREPQAALRWMESSVGTEGEVIRAVLALIPPERVPEGLWQQIGTTNP